MDEGNDLNFEGTVEATGLSRLPCVLAALVFIALPTACLINPGSIDPGDLDTSFLATGIGANNGVCWVAMQVDGKILIGGYFTAYKGAPRGHVARLNANGSLDASFLATGDGADGHVYTVVVQADGKILIGGNFSTYNGIARRRVARLNTDGSLDTSFLAAGDGAAGPVYSMAVQGNGKILIGGSFMAYDATSRGSVARLNTDGSLDTSFLATGDGAAGPVYSVAVQADGKILIAGPFFSYNGTSRRGVARLNTDGSLDASFLATEYGTDGTPYSVVAQADGSILISGSFSAFNGTARGCIVRLNTDGSLDTSFLATGAGADLPVYSVVVQADGKILIGGCFSAYNGAIRGCVARLNTDGSLDGSFLAAGGGADSSVLSVAVQADSRILIGGVFTNYNGTARGHVARLWN